MRVTYDSDPGVTAPVHYITLPRNGDIVDYDVASAYTFVCFCFGVVLSIYAPLCTLSLSFCVATDVPFH